MNAPDLGKVHSTSHYLQQFMICVQPQSPDQKMRKLPTRWGNIAVGWVERKGGGLGVGGCRPDAGNDPQHLTEAVDDVLPCLPIRTPRRRFEAGLLQGLGQRRYDLLEEGVQQLRVLLVLLHLEGGGTLLTCLVLWRGRVLRRADSFRCILPPQQNIVCIWRPMLGVGLLTGLPIDTFAGDLPMYWG